MNDINSSAVPSPPSLSSDLLNLYDSLDSFNRGVFVKIYRYLWNVVYPWRRLTGHASMFYTFWAVDQIRCKYNIPGHHFCLLSFISHATDKGKNYIKSSRVFNSGVLPGVQPQCKDVYLSELKKMGYVVRSWYDPKTPRYKPFYMARKGYINLSPEGIELITSIEHDLYKLLMRSSLNDLTGANKKPG